MSASLSAEIIAKAESFPGVKAGIARLSNVLKAPSHQHVPDGDRFEGSCDERAVTEWPPNARSVLVLGLYHPEDNPGLDWWDGGNTPGNRRLMAISESLKQWLEKKHGIGTLPLPYYVERGGLFLKDAAVLAGLGIIGRNNLLLNPEWGPHIRLRSLLIGGEPDPSEAIEGFFPCQSCGEICHGACPQNAFSTGTYRRSDCIRQMEADIADRTVEGETGGDGIPGRPIKYCRACELICPVGERFSKK